MGSESGVIAAGFCVPPDPRSVWAARAQFEPAGVNSEAAIPADAPWSSFLRENEPFPPLREDVFTLHLRNAPFEYLYAFYSNSLPASSRLLLGVLGLAAEPSFIQLGYNTHQGAHQR